MISYVVELSSTWNVGVLRWKYTRNKVSSLGFHNDTKMTKTSVDVTVQVIPLVTMPNEDWCSAISAKLSRWSTASDLSVVSAAMGTTISRQTMYKHLGHIGLYARRPVRCVQLMATHCHQQLAWSRKHAI
ncbi:transposable element Tcb1 transposase [Trichonephila clavipes]|uniref:Transposable element Tcb1 transposase n=1 Tax=Trichonephila clavipes TaxID=2585209 RepID=A0A8X6SE42_TRICX|nr:transposable element Tcb1 transposase [Trichonephila clavipes]